MILGTFKPKGTLSMAGPRKGKERIPDSEDDDSDVQSFLQQAIREPNGPSKYGQYWRLVFSKKSQDHRTYLVAPWDLHILSAISLARVWPERGYNSVCSYLELEHEDYSHATITASEHRAQASI